MNWARGFFRLWLLVAVPWVIGAALMHWPETPGTTLTYSPWDDQFHIVPPPLEWNFGCNDAPDDWRAACTGMAKKVSAGMVYATDLPGGLRMEIPLFGPGESEDEFIPWPVDFTNKGLTFSRYKSLEEKGKARMEQMRGLAVAAYGERVASDRLDALKDFAVAGLVPPLALLGIGLALWWALRGFRKPA